LYGWHQDHSANLVLVFIRDEDPQIVVADEVGGILVVV
jgi:hypothetical protein